MKMKRLTSRLYLCLFCAVIVVLSSCGKYDNDVVSSDSEHNSMTTSYNGHEYVDLGLSVYWATSNIGANDNPTSVGNLYAFGETTPKNEYTSSNYVGGDNDVVNLNWGGNWRLPTKKELEELVKECKWELKTIEGRKIMSATGPNGNHILLPYCVMKYINDGISSGYLMYGWYWSSTKYSTNEAWSLHFDDHDIYAGHGLKYHGYNARGVFPNPNYNGNGGGSSGGGTSTYEKPEIGLVDYTCRSTSITIKYRIYNQDVAHVTSAKVYYGTSSPSRAANTSVAGSLITANISGLQRNTTYYFKCTATGPGGTTTSETTRLITAS